MFESDIVWVEFIVQISIVVPACTLFHRMVGFKKLLPNVPAWLPGSLLYFVWKVINEVTVRWPELIPLDFSTLITYRAIVAMVFIFVVMPKFFNGSFLKRYFAFFPMEVLGIVAYIFRVGCMAAIRSCGAYEILESNVAVLLVVRIIIEWLPFFLLMWILRKPIKQYHDNEIKKKGIFIAGTVIIFCLEGISFFLAINVEVLTNWRMFIGGSIICGWLGFRIYFQNKQNETMYLQKKLMENHYQSIKNQTEQIERVQTEVGELLHSVEQYGKQTGYFAENIKEYEAELKEIYQKLKRIDYCNSIVIDAVLHSKVRECEKKGIGITIDMQDIKLGEVSEIDVFEIVYEMLDLGISQAEEKKELPQKAIAVKGKNIAGQLLFEVDCPESKNVKKEFSNRFKRVKRNVHKLEGYCTKKKEDGIEKIMIGIPCKQI